jgi:hypothetical protein
MRTRTYALVIVLLLSIGVVAAVLEPRPADGRERELGEALVSRTAAHASSFGSGRHRVGTDIEPGRYHTDGVGTHCYWASFDLEGEHLASSLVEGPQTVTVDSAFFETQDCGTWQKLR